MFRDHFRYSGPYMWIITDYYWWWLAGICLILCWDLWMKSGWPGNRATVVSLRRHAQKFHEGQEDDHPIPMDEQPTYLLTGKPKPTHVKTTLFLEYEFTVKKKVYRTKKKIENKRSDYLMGRLFDPEPFIPPDPGKKIMIFYNPSSPEDNLFKKPSGYSAAAFALAGLVFLILGLFRQGPFTL